MGWGWLDYVPVVSNVKGALEGDYKAAVHGPVKAGYEKISGNELPDPLLDAVTRESPDYKEERAALKADAEAAGNLRTQFANDLSSYSHPFSTRVDPVKMSSVTQAGGAYVDPTVQASVDHAAAGRIATKPQNQMRAGQLGLVSDLQGAAAGTSGPSAAESVLRRGIDEAISSQAALAGQARGSNVALAQRQAAVNASSLQTRGAQEAAILRAQEQQAARKELGDVLGTGRGQDIGLATSQAGFDTTTNIANMGADKDIALANAKAENDRSFLTAQLGVDVSKFNAQQANTFKQQMVEINAKIAMANASGDMEAYKLAAAERESLRQSIISASRLSIDANAAVFGGAKAANDATAAKDSQWLSMGSSALALLSDADRKEMIQALPENDKDVQQFMDVLNAYSYRYQDPDQDGAAPGERFGITVQDVEKSKIGKTLVMKTPGGKQINVPQATGALMAMVGSLNKRIKSLEGKR